jgi:hypothetical protein
VKELDYKKVSVTSQVGADEIVGNKKEIVDDAAALDDGQLSDSDLNMTKPTEQTGQEHEKLNDIDHEEEEKETNKVEAGKKFNEEIENASACCVQL